MDRSSSKHGPRLDEEMKKEVEDQVRSGRPTSAEEWHDPKPQENENSPDVEREIKDRVEAEKGRTESAESESEPESGGGESATNNAGR